MKKSIYRTSEIRPGVYCIWNCFVGCTLFVGEKRALLVDTGYGFEDIRPVICSITQLPFDVVLTHGHYDHAGGNALLDCKVWIHEAEVSTANRHLSPEYRRNALDTAKRMQRLLFWVPIVPKGLDEKHYIESGTFDNYQYIKEGNIFDLGGLTLQVVEMPGHTVGSIGLLCPELRLLLTGDAVGSAPWLHLPESSNLKEYVAMLRKLLALDFDEFLMSHKKMTISKREIESYLDVAENLDWDSGKIEKKEIYATDAESRRCWRKGVKPGSKTPSLVISKDKL